jgi:myosin-5
MRRVHHLEVKRVVLIQSCMRRRLAKKQLKTLRLEARSVSKFKEISYRLENKVVELTQNLQTRTRERKEVQAKLTLAEQQLTVWISRSEDAESRAKQLQTDLTAANGELSNREVLLREKDDIERRLDEALVVIGERDQAIKGLEAQISRQASELEAKTKELVNMPMRNDEDTSVISTLKNEVSSLREQLNRSFALNALTKGAREPPLSPTFAPALRHLDSETGENGGVNGAASGGGSGGSRHQRRHSSAGVYAISSTDYRSSADELMMLVKRSQNPRAVSVAYNGEEGLPRFRQNGLADIYDDPAEEKIRLLQDIKHLDEDVLEGLVKGLKIPLPSLTNPSAVKEILFPANLISLVTNEMWKYGLIPESERFLANVMQTVQGHVMVSRTCVCLPARAGWLMVRADVPERGGYHPGRILALKRARNALVHLRCRVRHAAGHRAGRGERGAAV